jgi:hypothetical protein
MSGSLMEHLNVSIAQGMVRVGLVSAHSAQFNQVARNKLMNLIDLRI